MMKKGIQSPQLTDRPHAILNAVAFCFEQIEARYDRLCELLLQSKRENRFHEIISTAWDLIDWVERLRKLLGKGAGIKKKEEWYQVAMRVLAPAEDLRHFLQHFDNSVEECLDKNVSVFGSVSAYCAEGDGYGVVIASSDWERPGTLADGEIWLKTDIDFHPPIDQIVLSVGGRKAHLTNLFLLIRQIKASFDDYVKRVYQEVESSSPAP